MPLLAAPLSPREREAIRAALAAGAKLRARVVGDSMRPTLVDGDEVTLADGAPRPGEVVAVERAERLVIHRLVRREGGALVLRGDANLHDDPPVEGAALLGRTVGVLREGRAETIAAAPSLVRVLASAASDLGRRIEARAAMGLIAATARPIVDATPVVELLLLGAVDARAFGRAATRFRAIPDCARRDAELATARRILAPRAGAGGRWLLPLEPPGAPAIRGEASDAEFAELLVFGLESEPPSGRAEAAILLHDVYGSLPARRERVELLARITGALREGAPLFVGFAARPARPALRSRLAGPLARITGALRGHAPVEPGLEIRGGHVLRRFSPAELAAELHEAGLVVCGDAPSGAAYLLAVRRGSGGP